MLLPQNMQWKDFIPLGLLVMNICLAGDSTLGFGRSYA